MTGRYPTSFSKVRDLNNEAAQLAKFITIDRYRDALRFGTRYRLAASFKKLELEDYSNDHTGEAYGAVFRVFVAYTAYELLLKAIGITERDGAILSEGTYNGLAIRKNLEKHKRFSVFVTRIRDLHNEPQGKKVRTMLTEYLANQHPVSVADFGKGIRNAFAHGRLASAPVKTSPADVSKFCNTIAEHILHICDGELTKFM